MYVCYTVTVHVHVVRVVHRMYVCACVYVCACIQLKVCVAFNVQLDMGQHKQARDSFQHTYTKKSMQRTCTCVCVPSYYTPDLWPIVVPRAYRPLEFIGPWWYLMYIII